MRVTLVVIFALLFCIPTAYARPADVGPPPATGAVDAWSPQFMDGVESPTLDEATAAARAFDLIVALPTVYRRLVPDMKAANANLTLLAYMKGVFTYDTTLPEQAYAHDAFGLRIQGIQFPGTWLLDPTSDAVLAYDVARAQRLLAQSGYDGVFLDTIGTAPLSLGYVTGLPVHAATGASWTAADWLGATAALAGSVAAATGVPVIGNGLRDGTAFFDPDAPTSVLLGTGMTGGMAEQWLRGAGDPITAYPGEAAWKQDVDAIAAAGARGTSFLAVTKAWVDATPEEKAAWHLFAVASFLLGDDGTGYLDFTYEPGDASTDFPLSHLELGAALGPYRKQNSVYQRTFVNGRVLVNPRPGTFTIWLGGTYHTLDGQAVTSVTLVGHTALILTR